MYVQVIWIYCVYVFIIYCICIYRAQQDMHTYENLYMWVCVHVYIYVCLGICIYRVYVNITQVSQTYHFAPTTPHDHSVNPTHLRNFCGNSGTLANSFDQIAGFQHFHLFHKSKIALFGVLYNLIVLTRYFCHAFTVLFSQRPCFVYLSAWSFFFSVLFSFLWVYCALVIAIFGQDRFLLRLLCSSCSASVLFNCSVTLSRVFLLLDVICSIAMFERHGWRTVSDI